MASVDATFRKIQRDAARERMRNSGQTRKSVEAALAKTTKQPKGIELSYAGFLVSAQRSINKLVRRQLAAMDSILAMTRVDAARVDDLNDDITTAFNALRNTITKTAAGTGGILQLGIADHGAKTAAFNDAKYDTSVMNLLGIGNSSATVERSILKGWVTENTQLVRNMNAEQLGKLETLFLRALRDGTRSAQLEADVSSILGGSTNRARLIARDQVGKLNGQLDRQKQTEAGLTSYIWRGALDERERPTHVAREGVVFPWSKPPPDGNPGQPVQCRCSPEPDLTPLLGAEFAPEPVTAADLARATPATRAANRRKVAAKNRRRRQPAKTAAIFPKTPSVAELTKTLQRVPVRGSLPSAASARSKALATINRIENPKQRAKAATAVRNARGNYPAELEAGADLGGVLDDITVAPSRSDLLFVDALEGKTLEAKNRIATGRDIPSGFWEPFRPIEIVRPKTGKPHIQDGNHRLSAIRKTGATEVRVTVFEGSLDGPRKTVVVKLRGAAALTAEAETALAAARALPTPASRYRAAYSGMTSSQQTAFTTTIQSKIDPFPFKRVVSVRTRERGAVEIVVERTRAPGVVSETFVIGKRGAITRF